MIVATAGHVDHGKTSLVKQLTGVDTDRLEEEKSRGLTIELGFAYRKLPDGVTLGFIDVPGHSRFINTMIAGVNGIDLGLLVVAADDGLMPQTREHLDVMQLLGISAFILVITKIDRADASRVEEVARIIKTLVPAGDKVRVRSLRVRDGEAQAGQAGDRCALNIVGARDVQRGNLLAAINCLPLSSHLDVRFSLLSAAPFSLRHLSPAKLYIGTQRLACRIFFIEPAENGRLEPGQGILAQLILAEPINCCSGDRFLIRDDSESVTLGGGVVSVWQAAC